MSVFREKNQTEQKPTETHTISASAVLILEVSFLLFIYQKYSGFSHYFSLQKKNNTGFPTSGP